MRMPTRLFPLAAAMAVFTLLLAAVPAVSAEKVLQLPMVTDGPKSLDPVEGSTLYENTACSQINECLLGFKYTNPSELEPELLAELPTSDDDGTTWTFTLRDDVFFTDDPCFAGGKGRKLTTDDVFYTLKRVADDKYLLKNWWLLENVVQGLDEYKKEQNAAAEFDYDAPVEGLVKVDDRRFKIVLKKPVYKFLYTLTQFQLGIVAREAVEKYGDQFRFHPVGTGPFVLDKWQPKQYLHLKKNPAYREVLYPAREEWSREDRRLSRAAGKRVPLVDRIEITMYVEPQPMWLQFQAGKLGFTTVPPEYFEQAFDKRTKQLRPEMRSKGVSDHADALLDFIFSGFNMEDPLLGGLSPKHKALRQAISLAIDHDEINEAFYNGTCKVFDGPIPVGLDGHPKDGKAPVSYRGPNIALAKQKLAEAGWPNGKNEKTGEQLVIKYYTGINSTAQQQCEMMKRQLDKINVRFEPTMLDFSNLMEVVDNKKAPMFGFAWGSDYPDAENNFALFYSPNESPGANHFNYKRPEFDALYEKILTMGPSAERTKLYEQMRDMIIEDCPYVGSMGRTRYYLMAPWIENCRPTERTATWYKYLDVDDSKR